MKDHRPTNPATQNVVAEIHNERLRQIAKEGCTPEHDDDHADGSLAMAACCLAMPHKLYKREDYADRTSYMDPWPWDQQFDKRPYNGNVLIPPPRWPAAKRRKLLVQAAALLVAEIERLDRAAAKR